MSAQISFLPIDLGRWDNGPGGDAMVVPIWTDVRPLRGAAGLVDWRLCGRLSQVLREGRLAGTPGEKLLLVTNRIRWRRVLAIGVGDRLEFSSASFRSAVDCSLQALRGIGASQVAIALPGRDIDIFPADEAVRQFVDAVADSEQGCGPWLDSVVLLDTPAASKVMGDVTRAAAAPADSA
jgi:hypothetical protein